MNTCLSPFELETCSDCENQEYCARRLVEKFGCKELRDDYLHSWKVFVNELDLAPTLRDAYQAGIDAYEAVCGQGKRERFYRENMQSLDWALLGLVLAAAYLAAFSSVVDPRNAQAIVVLSAAALVYRQW